MLTRFVLNGTRRQMVRQLIRRSHDAHDIPAKFMKFRTGHMDEALLPNGDWKEAYNQLQSKYNKQLVMSITYFAATLGYIYSSGVIDLVLPPPYKNE